MNNLRHASENWVEHEFDALKERVDNASASVTKSGSTATIRITDTNGTTTTASVTDGAPGATGATGPANVLSIGTVQQGQSASATITGASPNQTLNLVLPKGDQGDDGVTPHIGQNGNWFIGTTDTGVHAKGDKGDDGSIVSVSASGTSTDEVRYITIDGVEKKLAGGSGGTSNYNDLTNKPQINNVTLVGNKSLSDLGAVAAESNKRLMTDAEGTKLAGIATGATAVVEATVSGWGFTKNTGTYSKPSGGIPSTDLTAAVQTSLGKADSALQDASAFDPAGSASSAVATHDAASSAHSSLFDGKQAKITASGILKGDGAGGVTAATAGTDYLTTHQDISGKANVSDFSLPSGGGAPSAQYVSTLFSGANTSLAAQVRYDLGTAITASAALVDRTINLVQVSSADIDLTLPGVRSDGRLRDFLIRIEMAAGATGTPSLVSFTAWEGDDMPTFAAGKNYLITLTETKAGTWFFKALELEAKTAPTP